MVSDAKKECSFHSPPKCPNRLRVDQVELD